MASIPAVKPRAVGAVSGIEGTGGPLASGRSFSEVLSKTSLGASDANSLRDVTSGLFGDLEAGRKRLDEIISQARAGKTFKPVQLLAMQAEVNSISEQMALGQKLVSEGISSVKRLWSMQV